jgi:ribonuclease P protein component
MGTELHVANKFSRKERIKSAIEIRNLFKNGKRIGISGAKLFYLENKIGYNRICFTLPHGYGNAVQRNASKRYSREAYRFVKTFLNTGYDLLLLVYPGNDSFSTRCVQIRTLCDRAGLIK